MCLLYKNRDKSSRNIVLKLLPLKGSNLILLLLVFYRFNNIPSFCCRLHEQDGVQLQKSSCYFAHRTHVNHTSSYMFIPCLGPILLKRVTFICSFLFTFLLYKLCANVLECNKKEKRNKNTRNKTKTETRQKRVKKREKSCGYG